MVLLLRLPYRGWAEFEFISNHHNGSLQQGCTAIGVVYIVMGVLNLLATIPSFVYRGRWWYFSLAGSILRK